MLKGHWIKKGDRFGLLTIVEETDPITKYGRKERAYLADCDCGNRTIIARQQLFNGQKRSCGCLQRASKRKGGFRHGFSKSKVGKLWYDIKRRCYCPSSPDYSSYGGRGIVMQPSWIDNAGLFIRYVIGLPHFGEKGRSIDRINNNKNYEEGNLRWALQHEQSINQRISSKNKTGYVGVYFCSSNNKFISQITVFGKQYYLGAFLTVKEGVIARNNFIKDNNLLEYKIQ